MTMKKKNFLKIIFLAVLIVGTVLIIMQQRNTPYQHDTGFVFGTEYHITYQSSEDLQPEIDKALAQVDTALSPFNKKSVITQVNNNRPVKLSEMFTEVFSKAESISRETDGAFDITVAPLVNAWGFGFKSGVHPSRHVVDSLRQFVGYTKVALVDGRIVKKDPRLMLDCSGIAKGYGVDVVAKLLRDKGIENFMVEIGGEIVSKTAKGYLSGSSRPKPSSPYSVPSPICCPSASLTAPHTPTSATLQTP